MSKCAHGVMWKDSTAGYRMNAIERTMNLEKDLRTGKYTPRPPKHFTISSPKSRDIASITFRDRVYQRSLNDNCVYPKMTRSFILDNCACQKGKGAEFARNELVKHLGKYYRSNGSTGYVAQFDISGYYPNMLHSYAERIFESKLSKEEFLRVKRILNQQYDGDRGYNPGSQLIQIAGISALDSLDHFIKEQLHAKHYLRYMDDFIIIHSDKNYLDYCHGAIEARLSDIGFSLNQKKTRIYHLSDGIEFLGFRFSVSSTGKVIKTVRSENVKRQRKKIKRLVERSKRGLIPRGKVDESYRSWRSHAQYGDSHNLLMRMDKFYEGCWND